MRETTYQIPSSKYLVNLRRLKSKIWIISVAHIPKTVLPFSVSGQGGLRKTKKSYEARPQPSWFHQRPLQGWWVIIMKSNQNKGLCKGWWVIQLKTMKTKGGARMMGNYNKFKQWNPGTWVALTSETIEDSTVLEVLVGLVCVSCIDPYWLWRWVGFKSIKLRCFAASVIH